MRGAGVPVIHVNWAVRSDGANLPANVLDKGADCGAQPGYGDRLTAVVSSLPENGVHNLCPLSIRNLVTSTWPNTA